MKTSPKQTLPLGEGESTCSQADFPASPFLSPEAGKEWMMTAISGRKCYELYGKYSPLGSLAKMLLESSRWFSPAMRLKWEAVALCSEKLTEKEYCFDRNTSSKPSAETLNEKVTKSNRLLFRLVPSERPTAGTAFGSSQGVLLPTPTVMEDRRKPNGNKERQKKLMSNLNPFSIHYIQGLKINVDGKTEFMPMESLPTPTSIDSGSGRINKSPSPNAKERPTIALAAKMGLLPTPMSTEVRHEQRVKELKEAGKTNFRSREKGQSGANGLMDYMDFHGMLPTPVAQDGLNSSLPPSQKDRDSVPGYLLKNCPPSDGQDSPQLNPLFVEEMMGFPEDWLVSPFLSGEQNP